MVLCLEKIFTDRDTLHRGEDFSVTCSYLEVYNEVGGWCDGERDCSGQMRRQQYLAP
jgi:hypothetical protein